MNMRLGFGLFTAACSMALLHCSSLPDTCRGAACEVIPDGSTEGGTDGGPDVVQPPPGCDPAADAKDAPKCVVSEFGVFADATGGLDGNPGTKESPVKSITAAVGKLGNKNRVYVCEGTYAEHVKLTSAVSLYGGFACGAWTYSGTKAKVAPADKGLALELRGASAAVVLSDLELSAKDATEPGESSIAAFVVSSTKATFRRTTITAGKGIDGTDATAAADFAPANAPDGTAGGAGGAATSNPACTTSIGGAGGKDGTPNGGAGVVAVAPVYPVGYSGAGGPGAVSCFAGDGSYGVAGTPGVGASRLGTLDASGWKGAEGAPGGAGGNGQGGGGGGQKVVGGGGVGGSGGPGGCGGAGGGKGTAGGSSVALLVFQSSVALEQSTLVARDAGRGGNAAKGQKAQLGNLNPANGTGASACAGGFGGIGGSGGGGGGGAGGLSVGVLYKGAAPTVDGASTTAADTLSSVTLGAKGTAGSKGVGGDSAQTSAPISRAGQDGSDGAPGEAKAVMSVQ